MTMSKELEENKKKYDQSLYYQNFKKKHTGILTEDIKCSICPGHYTYYNKSRHNKSKRHRLAVYEREHNIVI